MPSTQAGGLRAVLTSEVFQGPSREREAVLTFDDGSGPDPPAIDFADALARGGGPRYHTIAALSRETIRIASQIGSPMSCRTNRSDQRRVSRRSRRGAA
jgi:hypothetical protein